MSNYNASSESEHYIDAARHRLVNLFYNNEMKFNFETFSTKLKATFDTMKNYVEGRYEQVKVISLREKIRSTNHKLEYVIILYRYNHNRNYLYATNYLATQTRFIILEHQTSQKINNDLNKQNVSHVKEEKLDNTKLCNGVDISDTTRFFLSEE